MINYLKKYRWRFSLGVLSIFVWLVSYYFIEPENPHISLGVLIQINAAPFYFMSSIALFYLTDKLFNRQKYLLFLLSVILLVLLSYLVINVSTPIHISDDKAWNFLANTLGILFMLSVAYYLRIFNKKITKEVDYQEYKARQNEIELNLLKRQLNPHFLFNTLNSIYAQCVESAPETANMIMQMSEMLRYQLKNDKLNTIDLEQEIEFINHYLFFEKRRLPKNMDFVCETSYEATNLTIAPNLLIVLIENTFKHGIITSRPSTIYIGIHLKGKQLTLRTENDTSGGTLLKANTQIGLENLQRRLMFLYEGKHVLWTKKANGKFIAQLEIIL